MLDNLISRLCPVYMMVCKGIQFDRHSLMVFKVDASQDMSLITFDLRDRWTYTWLMDPSNVACPTNLLIRVGRRYYRVRSRDELQLFLKHPVLSYLKLRSCQRYTSLVLRHFPRQVHCKSKSVYDEQMQLFSHFY